MGKLMEGRGFNAEIEIYFSLKIWIYQKTCYTFELYLETCSANPNVLSK
jgi:hypothetical protein